MREDSLRPGDGDETEPCGICGCIWLAHFLHERCRDAGNFCGGALVEGECDKHPGQCVAWEPRKPRPRPTWKPRPYLRRAKRSKRPRR